MADELIEPLAALTDANAAEAEFAVELPAQPAGHDMAVPEQLPDADAAFAEQKEDADAAAGWLGMWAGSLLLNDIAKDAGQTADKRRDKGQPKRPNCC